METQKATKSHHHIPIFPLGVVLLPDMTMPLHIFLMIPGPVLAGLQDFTASFPRTPSGVFDRREPTGFRGLDSCLRRNDGEDGRNDGVDRLNILDTRSRFCGMTARIIAFVILFVFQTLALLPDSALGRTQAFTGKAFNGGGQLEYVEEHNIIYEGEKVTRSRTTYLGPDEQVIGSLTSEYAPTPRFCNYTFRDLRRQYVDGARIKTDQICLFRKKGPEGEEETVCLPKDDKQIIGQGFHHFIVNQLDAIAAGEVFHVNLAFPSRLDQFGFRIRKKSIEGKNLFIRLEIDNWFLRLFTPHVDVVYERGSGRLLRYEGISNVADASGRFKKVQINYFY